MNLNQYYNDLGKRTRSLIDGEKDDFIASPLTEELSNYYFHKEHFEIINFGAIENLTIEKVKGFRMPDRFTPQDLATSRAQAFETASYNIELPITPHNRITELVKFDRPHIDSANLKWQTDCIILIIEVKGYGFQKTDEVLVTEIEGKRKELVSWIESVNTRITNLNNNLLSDINGWISKKKQAINGEEERFRRIAREVKIELKRKEDNVIQKVNLDPKPLIQRIRPVPGNIIDYVLDREKVLDVVSLLNNQGIQFEKTPSSYKSLQEPDLRNILLVALNAVFEGKATGETFSHHGKADIYLQIEQGQILIAECKMWSGITDYFKSVEQLMGYLTWRYNYALLITFSRKKDFTSILKTVADKINSLPELRGEKLSAAHFITHHSYQDGSKKVEVHHLIYNLFADPAE